MKRTITRTSPAIRCAQQQAGFGLLEASIALTLLSVTVMATFEILDSSRRFASSSIEVAAVEDLVQGIVYDIERELAGAAIESPAAPLAGALSLTESNRMNLAFTAGFPPAGSAWVGRGTFQEELIGYNGIDAVTHELLGLTRAQGCTEPGAHPQGPQDVLWSGMAELIDNQFNPSASAYDGQAQGEDGLQFFRGMGTGVVFRVPVDPTGNNAVLVDDQVLWGATLNEFGPTTDGYYAIYFDVRDSYQEARFGTDINSDGDSNDSFDIGQLRRVVWDATDPTRMEDVGIGPGAVIQETCNYGSDLNADGGADPMFLFDENRRTLHIRLTVLGRSDPELPITRSVESVVFLRNDPDA